MVCAQQISYMLQGELRMLLQGNKLEFEFLPNWELIHLVCYTTSQQHLFFLTNKWFGWADFLLQILLSILFSNLLPLPTYSPQINYKNNQFFIIHRKYKLLKINDLLHHWRWRCFPMARNWKTLQLFLLYLISISMISSTYSFFFILILLHLFSF